MQATAGAQMESQLGETFHLVSMDKKYEKPQYVDLPKNNKL